MELNEGDLGWDYNCPQYVDFTEPLPIDDDADKWFEKDHEDFEEDCSMNKDSGIEEVKELPSKAHTPKTATPKTATPKARVAPMRSGVKTDDEENKTPKAVVTPYKPEGSTGPLTRHQAKMLPAEQLTGTNIFTSLEQWRGKSTKTESNSEKKVVVVAPLRSGHGLKRQHSSSTNIRAESKSKSSTLKRSNSVTHADRVVRTHTRGYSAGRSGSLDGRKEGEAPAAKKPKTLCKPTTPTFMKRKKMTAGSPKVKTSEEQELEQIANMRKELERRRKMAHNSFKKVKTSNSYAPVHSSMEPTQPHDFNFSTDNRIKSKPSTAQDESMADFARSLRSGDNVTQAPKGNTRPQPFNFTATSHKTAAPREKYQSMAQSIAAFHRATPDRFRRRPRGTSSGEKLLKARSPRHPTLTQPQTPHLATRSRCRPVHVPSQKELEDQEYEELKKHQFKAHPVNTKIMSKPTGLHKPEPKPATEPEEFHLHMDQRIKERKTNKEDEDDADQFVFRAQPLPKKILEGTVGVHKKEKLPVTIPQSPAFALKNRVRLPVEIPQEKEPAPRSLRSGVGYNGIPFQPTLEHKSTTPEPFSFLGKYRHPNEVREELRKQTLEEEQRAREFHANPLPSLEPSLPEKNSRDPTRPEPFNLRLDIRGEKKSEEWNNRVEEEIAKQRAAAKFKARPAVVLQQEPFIPEKNSRLLTDVSCVVLNTERRAVDRDDYEMRKKAREAQLAEMNHERELQKQEEEKAAIAKLRAEMVHKPNPVRKFKPVVCKTSDKKFTVPQSPQFSDRLRRKVPSS